MKNNAAKVRKTMGYRSGFAKRDTMWKIHQRVTFDTIHQIVKVKNVILKYICIFAASKTNSSKTIKTNNNKSE